MKVSSRIKNLPLSCLLACCLILSGCKKHIDEKPAPPPIPLASASLEIISGNNQVGYPTKELSDSIIIKVIPEKPEFTSRLNFGFRNAAGLALPNAYTSYTINGVLYIAFTWKVGGITDEEKLKFLVYSDCPNPTYGNCKAIDSLIITATINKRQWVTILDNEGGQPGSLFDMHFSDDKNGIIVGDFDTGLMTTDDGGATWTAANSPRNDMYQLSFANSKEGIAIVTNNYAYFTSDGGKTFTQGQWSVPLVGHLSSSDYFMQDRNTIFTVGRYGGIAKTVDGGKSWTVYEGFNFSNRLIAITCTSPDTCYACGQAAKIIKTTDGGNTWQQQEAKLNNLLSTIYFINSYLGFAAGEAGAVIRTVDGGTNWTIIKTRLRFPIITMRFLDDKTGYIVSTAGEIGKTSDGGLTWKLVVTDNYGVYTLNKAYIKDSTIVFGLQNNDIVTYDLR